MAARRSAPKAATYALLAVYLPTLTPLVVGPLTGCEDCVASYLSMLPVVPGFFAGLPFGGREGIWQLVVPAGIATLLLLIGSYAAARHQANRNLIAIYLLLGSLIALQCHFLGHALRA